MITSQGELSSLEVCARIKQFGYSISQKIRIYGEEFEVLSDPFPIEEGIAIHVRSQKSQKARILQLPATVTGRASQKSLHRAA